MIADVVPLRPTDLAPTPFESVLRRGPMSLRRYEAPAAAPARLRVPVLLVPSIINRSYIFDLRPGQSVVEALLARGLDVYLVDWGDPGSADAGLGLSDYAVRLLGRAIDAARSASGADRVHLFGYCLGGTVALAHAARRGAASNVASVVALTTPVDLATPGSMGLLTDPRLVDLAALERGWRVIPGPALWAAFQALDPTGHSRKLRHTLELARAGDEERSARHAAQEAWLNDPVPMTTRVVRELVERLYRDNALAAGALELDGAAVDLRAGVCDVLNVTAKGDTVVPPEASRALPRLWGGAVTDLELPGGHIGVTVGTKAPAGLWKAAGDWLVARQG